MVDINLDLPDSFFEEEVRCGYTVTKEMKKAWAVELDLLNEFINVCNKYDLHYCLGAGTLLGAVRHKGFIPWDDDIDVYMLREDYDKLLEIYDKFKYPYFLQNSYTEKYVFRPYSKLRNSETTGCSKNERTLRANRGIFIDIFPLDGVDEASPEAKKQKKEYDFLTGIMHRYSGTYSSEALAFPQRMRQYIKKLVYAMLNKNKLARRYDEILKMFSVPGTAIWGNRTMVFECPKSRRPYGEWVDLIDAQFETLKVKIPRSYDAMLKQQYGDYMKFPKNKKNGSMHGELLLDTDVPYYNNKELEN